MRLEIREPVRLELEVLEIEEVHWPSFQASVLVVVKGAGATELRLTRGSLWFGCDAFDRFRDALARVAGPGGGIAELAPPDPAEFLFRIARSDASYPLLTLAWEIREAGAPALPFQIEMTLSPDDLAHIRTAVDAFPVWWRGMAAGPV